MNPRIAAAALIFAASSALAQHDFLGGKTAQEVIEAHSGDIEFKEPKLNVGDDAPKLELTSFAKGTPIDSFEEGSVYLVDFWATWCGPCIAAMPHLSELQEKHSGDGLTVLAIDIWERAEGDARTELVEGFVEKHDENMRYTVAIDGDKKLEQSWMNASGQRGIPTAMIVDRAGKLAWIGYGTDPSMDDALKAILKDEHDLEASRAKRLEEMRMEQMGQLAGMAMQEIKGGNEAEGLALMAALSQDLYKNDPRMLNAMAWGLVDDEKVNKHRAMLAKQMATQACEATEWKNPDILDTLAWAHHHLHEHDKAIEVEEKAIELAQDPRQRAAFEDVLETFKKAKRNHGH